MRQSDFMSELLPAQPYSRPVGDDRYLVVSLFSGAGGLDMGFVMEGFNIVWANDLDADACKTYASNIGDHIHCGDIERFMDDLACYKGNEVRDVVHGRVAVCATRAVPDAAC